MGNETGNTAFGALGMILSLLAISKFAIGMMINIGDDETH